MVRDLRGLFAFAWDDVEKTMLLARDEFGIKPLYYADDGKTMRFASQLKALLAGGGGIAREEDIAAWRGFFLLGSVAEPLTTVEATRALAAGASLVSIEAEPICSCPLRTRDSRIMTATAERSLSVGDLEATRNLTDVRDVVSAYDLTLRLGEIGAVYNICSGERGSDARFSTRCASNESRLLPRVALALPQKSSLNVRPR